jgi:regulator of protease activity HflC (stomatin/prohibitin superfamily)
VVIVAAAVGVALLLAVVLVAARVLRDYQRSAGTRLVLEAEARKQAAILQAEGDRQAAILRAEGYALALSKVFEVAHTVDANTMRLQYLDALTRIGSSEATKIVVPMELGDLAGDVLKRAKS